MSPARQVGLRLLAALATLLILSVLLFAAVEVLPGDAATAKLGVTATPRAVAQLRADLHLDDPLPVRYVKWLGGVVHGDLGRSLLSGRPVSTELGDALATTIPLALTSIVMIVLLSLTFGIVAGTRTGAVSDRTISALAVTAHATPPFVVAAILISLFALHWQLLPAVSLVPRDSSLWEHPEALALPVATFVIVGVAWTTRLVRAIVADANYAPHVEAARLAGLPEHRVVVRHLLPSVVAPLVQTFAWLPAFVLGASVVVERAFAAPGVGTLLVDAVHDHDTPTLEGVALLFATVMTISFILADIIGGRATAPVNTAL